MRPIRELLVLTVLASLALAQQPNTSFSSMTINGIDGSPFPIQQNVRRNTTAAFTIHGYGASGSYPLGQPFMLVQSANGQLSPGSATYFGDQFDLPLTPAPVIIADSRTNPAFHTDPSSGAFTFNVFVPGTTALNTSAAFQAAIADPTSPLGFSLTAATRVTIVAGPTIVNLQTGIGTYGDSQITSVNLASSSMSLPFYGTNYTTVHISGDGYMTFGGGPSPDFTPTDIEMRAGPPRLAAFWVDLDQGVGETVRYTLDNNPGPGQNGFLLVEFIGVSDAGGVNYTHTFSWFMDTSGFIDIYYSPANSASTYDTLCGIGPGNSLSSHGMKDLSSLLQPNSLLGANNESFFEWFGLTTMPYYTPTPLVNRPYDLFTRHLNFLPQGTGTTTQSTSRYAIY